MLPKNSGFQIGETSVAGLYGPVIPSKNRARVGIEQRAVGIEGAVLDRDRDLVIRLVGRELVVLFGSRAGKHSLQTRAAVQHFVVSGRAAPDEIETGRARIDVQAGHPQRVVVVPEGRGAVLVRVLEGGPTGAPLGAEAVSRLGLEEIVPGAFRCETRGNIVRGRQIPRFGVAVALVTDANGTVNVRHDRDRAGVLRVLRFGIVEVGQGDVGLSREIRSSIAARHTAGWVGPVQRRIDRQDVRQEVSVGVF